MHLPLWIVGLALLAWGWEIGQLALAVPLALLAAAPQWTGYRFALGRNEFHRALDVCWVLAFGGLLLIYSLEDVGNVLRSAARWLPVMAVPAVLAQGWSESGRIPLSAVLPWPSWRRRPEPDGPPFDAGSLVVILSLVSASTAGAERPWFFAVIVGVLGVFLWSRRARGHRAWAAAMVLVLAAAGGWMVARGLAVTQQWIEDGLMAWTTRWYREGAPYRVSPTAIGRTGRVGGSSRIIFQVRIDGGRAVPALWRTATYTEWRHGEWFATGTGFEKVDGLEDEWILDPAPGRAGALQVEWVRHSTRGLMPLPHGTRVLRELIAESVEMTPMGTVRADTRAGVVGFRAEYARTAAVELEPREGDREEVPAAELPLIAELAEELGLSGRPAAEVLNELRRHFADHFRYTTDLVDSPADDPRAGTALGRFLVGHRTGHCEYFATAGVLLLRAAGIPARYATGFLLDPAERAGGVITVREVQAHAWVRVWMGDAWHDFDPTPAVDFLEEPSGSSGWQRRWHELRFALQRWWWLGEKAWLRQAHWLTLPLLAMLLWRFRRLRAARLRAEVGPGSGPRPAWPGLDSEWLPIDAVLTDRGLARRPDERPGVWRDRLAGAGWGPEEVGRAWTASGLHDRLRFDPRGLAENERETLRVVSSDLGRALGLARGGDGVRRGG
ncbi:MAG: transglutaminase domain-containing protein [Verrucomicrobiae bacterium]|nr:transglutaminase domain-containing protein [Verrucomicrobiae bacterium]